MGGQINVKDNGAKALQFIEDVTTNCDAVQERVLAEILGRNAETEYLKRHRLEGRTDRNTFKSRVPVVTYEDILPDIQRIANGDFSPILTSEAITTLLSSSGTSGGESKLIPTTDDDFDRREFLNSLLKPLSNLYYPGLDKGKSLCFLFTWEGTKTPGGLVTQPASTRYLKTSLLKNRGLDPYIPYTSLPESILCNDLFQSMYSQILCGLYERIHVLRVSVFFASGLIRAINFLHLHCNDLCHDIATGTLNPKITDPSIQRVMSKIMKPDPDLARIVHQECSRENWEAGIIKRIWPNTMYLDVTLTGAMAQYITTIDYYSGGLPTVSSSYRSSECFLGLNLKPTSDPYDVAYTIMPNMGYFEFIPLDSSSSNLALVDLANVEVGKEYEIVITTYTGLYRYRMGDVVRATSFHNNAPEFQYVRRKNVVLSIDCDKTDEADLQKAVDNASILLRQRSDASIVEYTSYADTKTIPGHYVIYMELMMLDGVNGKWPTDELLRSCCLEIEESLNSVYIECRVIDESLGPLEIRIVRPGTFDEVMAYAVARSTSVNQYKLPRCISLMPMLEVLNRGVDSAHFSPALPRFSPSVGGGLV